MQGLATTLIRLGGVAALILGVVSATEAALSMMFQPVAFGREAQLMLIPELGTGIVLMVLGIVLIVVSKWGGRLIAASATGELDMFVSRHDLERMGLLLLGVYFAGLAFSDLIYWGPAVMEWLQAGGENMMTAGNPYEASTVTSTFAQFGLGLFMIGYSRHK